MLASLVVGVSPTHPELEGTARLAAEVPRQIANAHTFFNVINTVIFLGLTGYLARLVERLVPAKVEEEKEIIRPKFLDDSLIDTPALAMQRVRMEIAYMGEIVLQMFTDFREAVLKRERTKLEDVRKMDDQIDVLESAILRYLGEVRTRSLTEKESANIALAMRAVDELNNVGGVIATDLSSLGYKALDENIQVSDTMRYLFNQLGDKLSSAIEGIILAVREVDQRAAEEVLTMQADVDYLISQALELQSAALAEVGPDQIQVIRMEMSALENLKRIHTYLKHIARIIVPAEVGV